MANGLKKAWLWTRLVVIMLLIAWVVLFLFKNWAHKTDLWLFFWVNWKVDKGEGVPLTLILVITSVASVVVYYVVRKVARVIGQISEMREKDKSKQREKKMDDLARRMGNEGPAQDA